MRGLRHALILALLIVPLAVPAATNAQPSVTITGVVHDQHGKVPRQIVDDHGDEIPLYAFRLDGNSPAQRAHITRDGHYTVNVEPGQYELWFQTDDLPEPQPSMVDAGGGQATINQDLSISYSEFTMSGHVSGPDFSGQGSVWIEEGSQKLSYDTQGHQIWVHRPLRSYGAVKDGQYRMDAEPGLWYAAIAEEHGADGYVTRTLSEFSFKIDGNTAHDFALASFSYSDPECSTVWSCSAHVSGAGWAADAPVSIFVSSPGAGDGLESPSGGLDSLTANSLVGTVQADDTGRFDSDVEGGFCAGVLGSGSGYTFLAAQRTGSELRVAEPSNLFEGYTGSIPLTANGLDTTGRNCPSDSAPSDDSGGGS